MPKTFQQQQLPHGGCCLHNVYLFLLDQGQQPGRVLITVVVSEHQQAAGEEDVAVGLRVTPSPICAWGAQEPPGPPDQAPRRSRDEQLAWGPQEQRHEDDGKEDRPPDGDGDQLQLVLARELDEEANVRLRGAPLLHGIWIDLAAWIVLRFITGFCFAVLYIVIESWLNETATNANRGRVFSAYTLINMTMLGFGQQMMLLDDPGMMTLFALSSALVSLAALPVVLSTAPAPRTVETATLDMPRLYRTSPAGMLGSLAAGCANGSFWSLAPVFAMTLSRDVTLTAWFMTAGVIGGAASQWPLGAWSDRIDRRYVMGLCAASGVAVSICILVFGEHLTPGALILLGGLWGAVAFPLYSIAVAHSNDHAEEGEFVIVSSGLLLMYGLGAVIGPLVASGLMQAMGAGGLYAFTGVIHFAMLIYLFVRRLRRSPVADEEHIAFTEALTAAHTVSIAPAQDSGVGPT